MGSRGEPNPGAFLCLGQRVRDALSDRGFTAPTRPQQRAIPPVSEGLDTLIIAPTGTGKTETALLPIFDAIVGEGPDGFAALLITPLRALNRDMLRRLEWWGEALDVTIDVRHGDTSQYQRQKQANDPPDILITTPETLQAMLTGSKLRQGLEDIDKVVVDEIHELAGSKRGAQLAIGLERLRGLAGPYQRIGLSATVGEPEEVGRFLTGGRDCEIVQVESGSNLDVTVHNPTVTDDDEQLARELLVDADVASHLRTIDSIIEDHESTLVFVNTRQTAEALGSRFNQLGTNIGVHHGSLAKEARIDVEDAFQEGDLDALLCTSSMELGIDVGHIDHVVQYSSPRQVSRLVQRVGRSGHRSGEVSRGTIVTTSADDTLEALAIVRRASDGTVEPADIHHGSLDTVANQIAGMVMGTGELSVAKAYQLVTQAYPFQHLSASDFRAVVEELAENRVIWLDREEDIVSKRDGSWQYFYSNLSMIPDEATFEVHDMATDRTVGTLDERFVVNFAEPGEIFIQRGEMWRVVDIDDDREQVEVTTVEDPAGEVPSWTGEEIPVPFEVAQAVGRSREHIAEGEATKTETMSMDSTGTASTSRPAQLPPVVADQIADQEVIPTDRRILLEGSGRELVVNACFGHKPNETLGRLLAALLGQRTGSSVALDVDPYRIELEVPAEITGTDVRRILTETDPDHLETLLELSLKNTEMLDFRLSHIAVKFGALSDGTVGGKRVGPTRIMSALQETPAYDEAVREVFHEDFAVEKAAEILRNIQTGDIDIEMYPDRTPIGQDGRSTRKEFLTPENADASVISALRDRLHDDEITLFCVHCRNWQRTTKVRRVQESPRCPRCEATVIAALNPWIADDVIRAVKSDQREGEEKRYTERAYRSASLVQNHGKKAVIALAARGVGPENAARIINKFRETEADFYRDILAREKEYARTKAFWD